MNNDTTTQDDGFELLKKVIETNEKNIEKSIELEHNCGYLLDVHRKSQHTIKKLISTLEKVETFSNQEDEKRRDFLDSIPWSIQINLSDQANSQLEHFEKKSILVKLVLFGMIMALIFAVATAVFNLYFSKQWYAESTKAKSELRQEILDEYKKEGKSVYKIENYNQLLENTEIMNKWMKKNPGDAEKFLKFKEGYESK